MKIALAFSGGGYRASAFNLGTLTYLDKVSIDGESLLSKVIVLSTISGGTITGAKYALAIKKGESLDDVYTSLYKFFLNVDLISDSVKILGSSEHWQEGRVKSLINSFADIYDNCLFEKDKFGILLNEENPIHLKHISFNATEFTTGLQFRFQVSEKVLFSQPNEPEKGIIGNYENRIPEDIAKEIRMADILAASSCFPGGFEPINFPTDFRLPQSKVLNDFIQDARFPIGLMDGGIVDNQGIEPIILAEERMKRNNPDKKDNNLDLIIVSDVSSPYMEGFKSSIQHKENWWRRLTIQKIKTITLSLIIISVLSIIYSALFQQIAISIISTLIFTISASLFGITSTLISQIKKNGTIKGSKLKGFLHIKIGVFEDLLKNRIMSMLKLTGGVFMKHIRRLNYKKIYEYEHWKNRRIMNAIYELRIGEKKIEEKFQKGKISESLLPSSKIQEISKVASNMETSLWFEERHDENKTLDSLIACGQYNICWNLLEYIEKIKREIDEKDNNMNENHLLLISCEQRLREDWERFNKNPFWMVEQYNSKLILQ